jgi:ubiquinone biosynthesis protein
LIRLAGFISLVLTAAAVAFVTRRVLGVPVGWIRSVVVGMIMISAVGATLPYLGARFGMTRELTSVPSPVAAGALIILVCFWAFFIGTATLVVLELIVPTGSLPTPLQLVRGGRERWRRTRRYLRMMFILTRHGLGRFLRVQPHRSSEPLTSRASLARALTAALDDAGVTFVKVGQLLSARPDLVGPEFVRELSTLQSATTAVPWAELEPVLAASLGAPVDEVFAEIEPEPLAAASLGQVHAGVLRTGESVVVKIRRPGAPAQVQADLDILHRLATRLERSTLWAKRLGVVELAHGFADSLREELDYRVEAANTGAVSGALPTDTDVRVPRVFAEWSGDAVLVQDRIEGTPVGAAATTLAALTGERRAAVADELLRVVLHQVLVAGTFHADLHPGNVLVGGDGSVGMIDFGSVGRLDSDSREALALLLSAVDHDRPAAATDALMELLAPPAGDTDTRTLQRDMGQLIVRFRGGGDTAGMINSLFGIVTRHGLRVPGQVAAAFRTLASLEGTLRLIDPALELVAAARRQAAALGGAAVTVETMRTRLTDELVDLVPILRRLPRRLDAISHDLESGRLTIRARVLADSDDRNFVLGLAHQLIIAVLASAATVGAVVLLVAPGGPPLSTDTAIRLYPVLGWGLLFIGCVLALRALVMVFRRSS